MFEIKKKIVLIGDSGVGKTSLLYNYLHFSIKGMQSTIGCVFHSITKLIDNKEIHFAIWDTSGQEQFKSLVPYYLRDAAGALIVFSLTDFDSFNHLDDWLTILESNTIKKCPVVYCANKSDLTEKIIITEQKIKEKLKDQPYFITSSKNKTNVYEAFDCLFEKVSENNDPFSPTCLETTSPKTKKSGCC